MQLTKKDFTEILKSEIPQILSEYGVVTHTGLKQEILKSERRTAIRLTKVKNDLADRIANLALAKEERSKVERIDKRVTTLENFQFV